MSVCFGLVTCASFCFFDALTVPWLLRSLWQCVRMCTLMKQGLIPVFADWLCQGIPFTSLPVHRFWAGHVACFKGGQSLYPERWPEAWLHGGWTGTGVGLVLGSADVSQVLWWASSLGPQGRTWSLSSWGLTRTRADLEAKSVELGQDPGSVVVAWRHKLRLIS